MEAPLTSFRTQCPSLVLTETLDTLPDFQDPIYSITDSVEGNRKEKGARIGEGAKQEATNLYLGSRKKETPCMPQSTNATWPAPGKKGPATIPLPQHSISLPGASETALHAD